MPVRSRWGAWAGESPTPSEGDLFYLGFLAAAASLVALGYFYRQGMLLLYGDATAHIHIARRVFDSRTPGPGQLGTVWLPLPHLLILPFIVAKDAWQSGLGAAIPSMIAYVAGTLGIFRLVRGVLADNQFARIAAWLAALTYAANPNLLYLQSTAMTEPLYLALFIWATVYFSQFVRETQNDSAAAANRSLRRCGWCLMGAMLTRYDGWFAALVFFMAALIVIWRRTGWRVPLSRSPLRPGLLQLALIIGMTAAAWLGYNAALWGNPLEFANGPYSARAIEASAQRPGGWHYPGWHAPKTAAIYFFKAAKLNMAASEPKFETPEAPPPRWRLENFWAPWALLGAVIFLGWARTSWPALLLWLPLPFYTLSIAWSAVPIFLPVWWPYSYYNVRYGLQLLPALAVFPALAVYWIGQRWRDRASIMAGAAVLLAAFVAGSYWTSWRHVPICLREAQANAHNRIGFDRELANLLERLPPNASVLVYTARHAVAFQFAGFPLRRTINETNKGIWPAALAAPAQAAEVVIAFEGDPVWQAVQQHPEGLQLLVVISSPGQAKANVYGRNVPR